MIVRALLVPAYLGVVALAFGAELALRLATVAAIHLGNAAFPPPTWRSS